MYRVLAEKGVKNGQIWGFLGFLGVSFPEGMDLAWIFDRVAVSGGPKTAKMCQICTFFGGFGGQNPAYTAPNLGVFGVFGVPGSAKNPFRAINVHALKYPITLLYGSTIVDTFIGENHCH